MVRIVLLMCLCYTTILKTYGQLTVFQDEKGQVFTTYDIYESEIKAASHNKVTYLGSPFLTFPVWQKGKIQLDKHGQELDCELAYNLVNNVVMCRFAGDSAIKTITPEVFTISNTEFVRQQSNLISTSYRMYTTVLHDGPTKLLASLSSQLMPMNSTEIINTRYQKDLNLQGIYRIKTNYYIQKGDAQPELISLTKSSVLDVLYEQAEKIEPTLTAKKLTTDDVVNLIKYYDTLSIAANANKQPLTNDPTFRQVLHNRITYPPLARYNNAYGRVYAGFEITSQGIVKNIVMLSPDNGGAGFAEMVRQSLEKLPNLNPALRGKYALPVVFTYTNLTEKTGAHIPINQLSPDRLEARTLLEEFVIPLVVKKPITESREVWGYYK